MPPTKLRQLLDCFESAPQGISLLALARELELSPSQVENMIEFWIRKGRIQRAEDQPDCNVCRERADCPFLMEMPPYFELVQDT